MEIKGLHSDDFDAPLHDRAESVSAYEARVAKMMLGLLNALRRDGSRARLFASYWFDRELWLQYRGSNGVHCMLTITIDRFDYGPLEDGLPRFHYRMAYRIKRDAIKGHNPLIEERTWNLQSAVEFVRQAISETSDLP